MDSIRGLGRSPGEGHGDLLQYFCLENPMYRGAWWATVCRVAKSWTGLKRRSTHSCLRVFSPALLNVHPQILTTVIQVPLSGSSYNIPVMLLQTTYREVQPPSPFLCNYITFHPMYPYIMIYYFSPVLNLCIDSLSHQNVTSTRIGKIYIE